jgi:hypothetical protein
MRQSNRLFVGISSFYFGWRALRIFQTKKETGNHGIARIGCTTRIAHSITSQHRLQENFMPRYTLETIILVLLILWLVGWLVVPIAGGLVHLLLVVILVVIVIRLLQGRNPLP